MKVLKYKSMFLGPSENDSEAETEGTKPVGEPSLRWVMMLWQYLSDDSREADRLALLLACPWPLFPAYRSLPQPVPAHRSDNLSGGAATARVDSGLHVSPLHQRILVSLRAQVPLFVERSPGRGGVMLTLPPNLCTALLSLGACLVDAELVSDLWKMGDVSSVIHPPSATGILTILLNLAGFRVSSPKEIPAAGLLEGPLRSLFRTIAADDRSALRSFLAKCADAPGGIRRWGSELNSGRSSGGPASPAAGWGSSMGAEDGDVWLAVICALPIFEVHGGAGSNASMAGAPTVPPRFDSLIVTKFVAPPDVDIRLLGEHFVCTSSAVDVGFLGQLGVPRLPDGKFYLDHVLPQLGSLAQDVRDAAVMRMLENMSRWRPC